MISATLKVKGGKVQRQATSEFEELLPDRIYHHVVLGVQLSWPTHQAADQRVNAAWTGKQEVDEILMLVKSAFWK